MGKLTKEDFDIIVHRLTTTATDLWDILIDLERERGESIKTGGEGGVEPPPDSLPTPEDEQRWHEADEALEAALAAESDQSTGSLTTRPMVAHNLVGWTVAKGSSSR